MENSKKQTLDQITASMSHDMKAITWLYSEEVIMINERSGSATFTDGKREAVYSILKPITQIKAIGRARKSTIEAYNQNK